MRVFSGQRAWLLQRITALATLCFLAIGSVVLLFNLPLNYADWRMHLTSGPGAVLTIFLFGAICLHGWVGIRDIVLDYIQPRGLRLAVLALIAIFLSGILIRVALIVAARVPL